MISPHRSKKHLSFVEGPAPHMQLLRIYNHAKPYGHVDLPLSVLRTLLATQGLAIVPAAEVTAPAERKVLEAMAAVPDIQIDMTLDLRDELSIQETRVWEAELARRAEKKGETNG